MKIWTHGWSLFSVLYNGQWVYLIEDSNTLVSVGQGDVTMRAAMGCFPPFGKIILFLAVLWVCTNIVHLKMVNLSCPRSYPGGLPWESTKLPPLGCGSLKQIEKIKIKFHLHFVTSLCLLKWGFFVSLFVVFLSWKPPETSSKKQINGYLTHGEYRT